MVARNKTLKIAATAVAAATKYGRTKKISYKSASAIIAIAATAIHKINVRTQNELGIGGKKLHTTNFYFRLNFRVYVCDLKCKIMLL